MSVRELRCYSKNISDFVNKDKCTTNNSSTKPFFQNKTKKDLFFLFSMLRVFGQIPSGFYT